MQEQPPAQRTISIREAAQRFGVSESTVRRRIHSGEVRAFKEQTPYGLEWRVVIPAQHGGEGATSGGGGTTDGGGGATTSEIPRQEAPASGGEGTVSGGGPITTGGEAAALAAVLEAELQRLHEENRSLQRENMQLGGHVGYLQRQVQEMERQIRMLTMEKEPKPKPPAAEQPAERPAPKRAWWKRLFSEI